jgi:hypothetical protein
MIKLDSIWAKYYDLSKKRMDICMVCDKMNKKNKKCSKCGCFMDYKTMLPASECPLGKWQAEKEINNKSNQESI